MLAFGGHAGRIDVSTDGIERQPERASGAMLPAAEARAELPSRSSAGGFEPFLRVPPFPGATAPAFSRQVRSDEAAIADAVVDAWLDAVRAARVGGTYWGAEPALPFEPYILMRIRDRRSRNRKIGALKAGTPVVLWLDSPAERVTAPEEALCVTGVCDPWHLLSGASATIVDADDELALLAGVRGIALECVGNGRFAKLAGTASISALRNIFRRAVGGFDYFDPYSGDPISFEEAVAYCKFWRGLIDSNRDIRAAAGFAFWKRSTVSALLWGGADGTPFARKTSAIRRGESVALWRSRTSASAIASIERRGARLVEVEDGFIRSAGLGADCIPPLSIVVDRLGAHFDAKRPSELEQLLQNHTFSSDILDRARELRRLIVRSGVSKYECGRHSLRRRVQGKIHLLVTGQVEDDRAVICGGAGLTSNLELLQRVRAHRPDAHIMYKPHPDVEAGHRVGAIRPDLCLSLADEIVSNEPISALLDLADEVHVNTSLAGFEALLREKRVTTHGVPFYAGWGLTEDLGPVPPRRSARRTLDELVAAVLLLYPRYLDPVTGLPCPAEVLVRRLAEPQTHRSDGVVVQIRRVQGRLKRGLAALRGTR